MVAKLVVLCEYAAAKHFATILATQSSTLAVLPTNLKGHLFTLLSHRGLLTDANLPLLLNSRTRTFDFRECADISDDALTFMASAALNPFVLYLRSANITDHGVIQFVQRYPALRKIRLQNCSQITDESVLAIGASCARLLELDLAGCLQITDRAIDGLKQLTQLRSIGLTKTQITDESLMTIGQSAFRHVLNEINLKMCVEITDDGFIFLLHNCPALKNIGSSHCPRLTARSRQTINTNTHPLSYFMWSIPV